MAVSCSTGKARGAACGVWWPGRQGIDECVKRVGRGCRTLFRCSVRLLHSLCERLPPVTHRTHRQGGFPTPSLTAPSPRPQVGRRRPNSVVHSSAPSDPLQFPFLAAQAAPQAARYIQQPAANCNNTSNSNNNAGSSKSSKGTGSGGAQNGTKA